MKIAEGHQWHKVRQWEVRFEVHTKLPALPYPEVVVREIQRTPRYRIGPREGHGNGQLSITVGGEGRVKINGTEHRLTPGDAFLHLHADTALEYYYPPPASEPWHFLWISFNGPALKPLISDINRGYGYLFTLNLTTGLVPMLSRYKDFPGAVSVLSPLEGAKLCTDILAELVRERDVEERVNPAHVTVAAAQDFIRRSLLDRLSVQEIADHLNVSREHLSRTFRQITGETIQAYQFREKMDMARQMLRSSSISCKELGYQLGYDNVCSFSRAFASYVGLSPSAFRRSSL